MVFYQSPTKKKKKKSRPLYQYKHEEWTSFYLKNFEADQRPQKQAENKEKLNQKK